jgi:acetyl esterase/lipase
MLSKMRNICILLLFSGFFSVFAASQQIIPIWDTSNATKKMKKAEMVAFIANENTNGLSVIICPGGSYRFLAMKKEGTKVAKWLQQNGITAFVLRYRVGSGNRFPAMVEDLQRAIQLVKENHSTYGIDTCKMGIMGFSAGGHLVGTAATYSQTNFMKDVGIETDISLKPNFVAMIYPVVSMTEDFAHQRSRRNLLGKHYSPETQRMLSLEQNVHTEMPPVFIVHCTNDKTVDFRNAQSYSAELARNGVPCEFITYNEKGHGFGINPDSKHAPSWINSFIPWLQNIKMIDDSKQDYLNVTLN